MQTDNTSASADKDSKSSSAQDLTTDGVFWEKYSKEALEQDNIFHEKNGNNIEGVMLFAGLFSAVAAAFLAVMMGSLQPAPSDTTNALLMMIVHSINNTAFANQDLGLPVWNGPSPPIICSLALGYAALSASLLAALGAVLGKQWLSDYSQQLQSGPLQERSRRRQQKLDGLKAWRIDIFMGALPALIQLALLLFSISLAIYLWELNHAVGMVVIVATAIGLFFYLLMTLASLTFHTCPFHTPVSSTMYGAIGTTMKSVEAVAEYWACLTGIHHKQPPPLSHGNKVVAYAIAVFFSPLLAIAYITVLMVFGVFRSLIAFVTWVRGHRVLLESKMDSLHSALRFKSLKPKLHGSLIVLRNSATEVRDRMRNVYLEREPDHHVSDPSSIAWLLKTSLNADSLMAAAEFVPEVEWFETIDISIPIQHVYSLLIRSIPERGPSDGRALRFGKAFVVMLPHVSSPRRWWKKLQQDIAKEGRKLNADDDPDLLFLLSIVSKFASHRQETADYGVKFPKGCEVSESVLVSLLRPLQVLLPLEKPDKQELSFLREAERTFFKLGLPEESNLRTQYLKTFEVYFNTAVDVEVEKTKDMKVKKVNDNRADKENLEELKQMQNECLKRVLERLKKVDTSRLFNRRTHSSLIIPMMVLSRLTSVSYLQQTFKDSALEYWIANAFREIMRIAADPNNGLKRSIWPFANHLMDLATITGAFGPIKASQDSFPQRAIDSSGQTRLRMDSKTLFTYLFNNPLTVSTKQTVYALNILHANTNELPGLASDTKFINYIVSATHPGQDYSIREIGLRVVGDVCGHLLDTYDGASLKALSHKCDLLRLLRRAFLHQDPPVIMTKLLRNHEHLNPSLLNILESSLGDPFKTLLEKLGRQPDKFPERNLRDLEMVLVLSNNEGRKEHLFNHLDRSIAQMSLQDYRDRMALPLVVVIGWLLRADGPLVLSKDDDIWMPFLRPKFEELLYPAWGNMDRLDKNPQMLRLLLGCTEIWFWSIYKSSPTSSSLESNASTLTIKPLEDMLERLRDGSMTLSFDINRAVQRLSKAISTRPVC